MVHLASVTCLASWPQTAPRSRAKDVPEAVLRSLYHRISEDEIRMNEGDQWEGDVVTFMAPQKSGWLSKQNHGGMTRWKRHWFVLSEHVLYYFEAPGERGLRCA